MFTVEPAPTQFDLHFRVAGFPVRVHPFFWLMTLMLGARDDDPMALLIWIGVVFVSILVHELGHALLIRYFGQDARIVLYMMGGLAIPESSRWGSSSGRRPRGELAQILISAAGPGAGFLLGAVTAIGVLLGGGDVEVVWLRGILPIVVAYVPEPANVYVNLLVNDLLWANIFWGLINLLPVNPLDGGTIARELLTRGDPWQGTVKSLWLSVIVGAGMAVVGFSALRDPYIAIFFAVLAFSNYTAIQNLQGRGW